MSFDVQSLVPHIKAILTAPGVDLTTISAKRVRKRLIEEVPGLTPEVARELKEEIDPVIAAVFHAVSEPQDEEDADEEEPTAKRKHEDDDGEEEVEAPRSKSAKRSKKEVSTDEEIARKLDQELNSRQRSSRSGAKPKKTPGKRSKKVKSAETIESDGEGGDKPKKRGGGGLSKEYALSEPLAALLGLEKLSRPQVVKQIWVYIKANGLQNPSDKREIICDENLKGLFHTDKIGMFKMNQMLGQHLLEPHEAS